MIVKQVTWFSRFVDIAPYMAGLIALIIPVIFNSPSPMTLSSVYAALGPGGIISILVFLVSDRLATSWQQRQQQVQLLEQLSYIENAQRGLDRVRYLGSPDDAIKYVGLCICDAKVCWNTYLNYGVSDGFGYSKDNHDIIKVAMREFLQDEKRKWIDVVSNITEEFAERIAHASDGKKKANYQCFRLNVNVPSMNFIVIQYMGARKDEVIFGWGKHPKDEIGNVFITDNELMVDSFKSLHSSLREREVSTEFDPIKDKEIHGREYNSMVGEWFIGLGKIIDGTKAHGTPVEDVAIISIHRNRGKLELNGSTFQTDGRKKGRCTALAIRENARSIDILMEETGVFGRDKVNFVAIFDIITRDELQATYYDLRAGCYVKADGIRIQEEDRVFIVDGKSAELSGIVIKYSGLLDGMT